MLVVYLYVYILVKVQNPLDCTRDIVFFDDPFVLGQGSSALYCTQAPRLILASGIASSSFELPNGLQANFRIQKPCGGFFFFFLLFVLIKSSKILWVKVTTHNTIQ